MDQQLPYFERQRPLSNVVVGEGITSRLEELGLGEEIIVAALNSGHAGAALATAQHAKTAAGTYRWHETLASLRAELVKGDWKQRDEKNAPRIVSPDGSLSIMVATGNSKTGTQQNPSNVAPKGYMTERDVRNNGETEDQLPGFGEFIEKQDPATWVLLYFYSKERNHIRSELSRPNPVGLNTRGYIDRWDERIILPPVSVAEAELLADAQPDSAPEIDFFIGDENAG